MSALDWPGLESLEFDAPQRAFGRKGDAPAQRLALLEQLEDMALETAHLLAVDLLRNGWRPD